MQCFRLAPRKTTTTAHVALDDAVSKRTPLKGVSITHLPINMNDAITVHKLQGMSKDRLIIISWSLMQNWIYVVLSRVHTLKGLFLLKHLADNCLDKFQVPQEFQAFECRMYALQQAIFTAHKTNMGTLENNYEHID